MLTIISLCVCVVLVWCAWRCCKWGYNWLFGGGSSVVTEAEMMETWQEHIEQRSKAFSDGLSENAVEAKGLVNYTWEEWQNRQKEKQLESTGKTNAEVIGDKAKEIWQDVSTTKVKAVGEKAKAFWRNLTSKEEKDPEEELKRLNARLAELEGRGANGGQQNAAEPKTEKKSTSFNVTRKGDEAIVTVTSERASREDAWQSACRMAVKGAVSVFVGNPKLLMDNNDRFEERLNTVSMRDIKRYEPIKDMQQGDVFTVQIKAWVEKETLARKFKDIFPDAFVGAGARKQASKNLTND